MPDDVVMFKEGSDLSGDNRIDLILEQTLRDSAAQAKRYRRTEDRETCFATVLDWARWQVAMNGGHWLDYANPFESRLAEAWRI